MNPPSAHPNWDEILTHVESGSGGDALSDHLRSCPACSRIVDELRELLTQLETARLPQPPAELLERTFTRLREELGKASREGEGSRRSLGEAALALLGGIGEPLREHWAALVADSLRPSPLLRGSASDTDRTLLFETDDYSIALGISSGDGATQILRGQVSPKTAAGLPAEGRALILQADELSAQALSEYGEFRFAPLTATSTELGILLENLLIRFSLPS